MRGSLPGDPHADYQPWPVEFSPRLRASCLGLGYRARQHLAIPLYRRHLGGEAGALMYIFFVHPIGASALFPELSIGHASRASPVTVFKKLVPCAGGLYSARSA